MAAQQPSYTYTEGKFDISQAQRCAPGSKVPLDEELLVLDEGDSDPRPVKIQDVLAGKEVVLFGLPGAYTSVCSSKHVPQYNERLEKLREAGVDSVVCVSVNATCRTCGAWILRPALQILGSCESGRASWVCRPTAS